MKIERGKYKLAVFRLRPSKVTFFSLLYTNKWYTMTLTQVSYGFRLPEVGDRGWTIFTKGTSAFHLKVSLHVVVDELYRSSEEAGSDHAYVNVT